MDIVVFNAKPRIVRSFVEMSSWTIDWYYFPWLPVEIDSDYYTTANLLQVDKLFFYKCLI